MAETFAARGDTYWSLLRSVGPDGRLAFRVVFSSLQWGSERAQTVYAQIRKSRCRVASRVQCGAPVRCAECALQYRPLPYDLLISALNRLHTELLALTPVHSWDDSCTL